MEAVPPLKVIRALVVIRHGDRAPIAGAVGTLDSASAGKFWLPRLPSPRVIQFWARLAPVDLEGGAGHPASWDNAASPFLGRLTARGGEECVAVGTALRKRYAHFFTAEQTQTTPLSLSRVVAARATNITRTQWSAQCVVVGLRGSVSDDGTGDESIVPVRVVINDPMLASHSTRDSPRRALLMGEMVRRGQAPGEDRYPGFLALKTRVVDAFYGGDHDADIAWAKLREVVTCNALHGYATAESSVEDPVVDDAVLLRDVVRFNGWLWGSYYIDSPELCRLSIGRFVHELLGLLLHESDETAALLLYAGHDGTLVPLLCALEIFDGSWPDYAATLTIELAVRAADGVRLVRVLKSGVPARLPIECDVKGGGGCWIEASVFIAWMRPKAIAPEEWDALCTAGEEKAEADAAELRALSAAASGALV